MNFKGVENDSQITAVGQLFRRRSDGEWKIDLKLKPEQSASYLDFSQMPVLARRRVLNPTSDNKPAGYGQRLTIQNAQSWKTDRIHSCPVPAVRGSRDANQLCFVFRANDLTFYLPQLELARALFFHSAYLARLSLVPNGLVEEFDVEFKGLGNQATVNILPSCRWPAHARGDHALRRHLAWILFDPDARRSFDSISQFQIQNGRDINGYRRWEFQFTPPPLTGVQLDIRGHLDRNLRAMFVYEIHGVANLRGNCPAVVHFVDPNYRERRASSPAPVTRRSMSGPKPEIDDDGIPDIDQAEFKIDPPKVTFEFVNPVRTNRISNDGRPLNGGRGDGEDAEEESGVIISTGETSTEGTMPSGDYDGVEDESDDAHLYADKFQAFDQMVEKLLEMPNCRRIGRRISKLPRVDRRKKHELADGNPRCIAVHLIQRGPRVFALLEVDTSDDRNRLSTLLLWAREGSINWREPVGKIARELVVSSLAWPTDIIERGFRGRNRRIPHPRTSSKDKSLLEEKSIDHWAARVYAEMIA